LGAEKCCCEKCWLEALAPKAFRDRERSGEASAERVDEPQPADDIPLFADDLYPPDDPYPGDPYPDDVKPRLPLAPALDAKADPDGDPPNDLPDPSNGLPAEGECHPLATLSDPWPAPLKVEENPRPPANS
jgi:hypothetical protein